MKQRSPGYKTAIPFQISTVAVDILPGVIGISSCPGMKISSGDNSSDDWLENDLQSICRWGAAVIVTLLDTHELVKLGAEALPEKVCAKSNLQWLHLPISDMCLPDDGFEEKWQQVGPKLLNFLKEGKRILIHCKQGIGRSGIVAARLLIESGIEVDRAIRMVRKATPGSLMLYTHEEYCYSLETDICEMKPAV